MIWNELLRKDIKKNRFLLKQFIWKLFYSLIFTEIWKIFWINICLDKEKYITIFNALLVLRYFSTETLLKSKV